MFSAAIQVRSSLEAKAPTRRPDLEPPNVDKVGFEFEGPRRREPRRCGSPIADRSPIPIRSAVGLEQLVILTRVTFRSRGTVEVDSIEGS